MSKYQLLASNATTTPTLLLDCNVPSSDLLANAQHRIEAARNLAATLSMVSDTTRGIQGRDLSAFAVAVELLTSDAADLLNALEHSQLRANKGAP